MEKKKKVNNGKAFENLVAIIHESLKHTPDTEVITNYRPKDKSKSGKRRQFDVFIRCQVQGMTVNIAIECKDYKDPVKAEKIEAFHSKCKTVPNINKKIMVSPKGFQKGAKENAKEFFDIDLYELKNVDESIVKTWIDPEGARKLTGNVRYLKYWLVLNDRHLVEAGSEALPFFTKVTTKEGLTAPLQEVAYHTFGAYFPTILQWFSAEAYKLNLADKTRDFKLYNTYFARSAGHDMWLEDNNKGKVIITEFRFLLEFEGKVHHPEEIEVRGYNELDENSQANVVSIRFDDDTSKINLVKLTTASDEVEAYYFDAKGKVEKLDENIIIDIDSGEIIQNG